MKDKKRIIFAYIFNLIICILIGVLCEVCILDESYVLIILATMLSYGLIHLLGWGASSCTNKYAVFQRIPYLLACVGLGIMFYSYIPLLASARILNPMLANAILSLDLLSVQNLTYLLIMLIYTIIGAMYLRRVWIEYYEE